MNLEESNSFVEEMEKNNRHKKNVIMVLIVCAILIVILAGIIGYMKYQDSLKLKVFVDNKEVSFSGNFFEKENGINYMNVRELANMLNYSYQKGEYKKYTEDANSCYLRTPYEIVSMSTEKDTVTKYLLNEAKNDATEEKEKDKNIDSENMVNSELVVTNEAGESYLNIIVDSENDTQETFSIEEPILLIDGELYVSFDEATRIFNIQLDSSKENRVRISSLTNLVLLAKQYAEQLGYQEISNLYENLTAIVDGMIVVSDGTNYGVVSTDNQKEKISLKYEKIRYMQSTSEFLVTAEGSVGIVSKDGDTIIKPTEYDNISILDEVKKLYLVEKDKKYGVLNGNGDTIVYCEYDSIGVENKEDFANEEIRNFNLLFDELIPVNIAGKTGLIDLEGNEVFKPVYTLGYVTSTSSNNTEKDEHSEVSSTESNRNTTNTTADKTVQLDEHDNVLIIPETMNMKGIVVKNYNDLYGIYDAKSKGLIPCSFSKIYSKTKAGVTTYYLEYDGQELELSKYLRESGFLSINGQTDDDDDNVMTNSTNEGENNVERVTNEITGDENKEESNEIENAENNSENSNLDVENEEENTEE